MNEEKIKKQAKEILDKFASALNKVETENEDFYVERKEFEREEGEGKVGSSEFKKMILENAPKSDDDFIIAEKGAWKS